MAKDRAASMGSFWHELVQFRTYKPSQGKMTRQVTFVILVVTVLLAAWRMYNFWPTFPDWWQRAFTENGRYLLPGGLMLVGLWISFRVVNYPRFADFLVAVEAEMNKVSWPSRTELVRSSIVVIVVILALAALLFAYDLFWRFVFGDNVLGIIKS